MRLLRAMLVTPTSGPLQRFGVAGAVALRLWAEHALQASSDWSGVDLEVVDAHPSATAAVHAAVSRRPDVIFGPYGASPAVAVAKAIHGVLWNHGGATARLRRPEFAHVVNVLSPAATYFAAVLRAIHSADPRVERVSLLHGSTQFGREVAAGAAAAAKELRLDLNATSCVAGQVTAAAATLAPADALLVAGSFEDELDAARVLLARGWRAAAFVGAGVDEALAQLGPAREGLLGPAQWVARVAQDPDEGPDAAWFVRAFRQETSADPPYPAAAAFAAGALVARCLRELGGAADEEVLRIAAQLSVRTLFGEFRLDSDTGLQVGHEILVVQWQDGVRRVVWPLSRAERDLIQFR
jgi:branched-chain amino acid transport system substrate-binding protein